MRAHEYIYRKDSVNAIIYKQQVTLKARISNKMVGLSKLDKTSDES
jgi:hypothetical protein